MLNNECSEEMQNQNGYALLIIVLVAVSVALAVSVSLKLQTLSRSDSVIREVKASQNFTAAQSCLEEAIRKLRMNPSSYVSDSLAIASSTCAVSIIASAPEYTIKIISTRDTLIKILEGKVTLTGQGAMLNSWRELTN